MNDQGPQPTGLEFAQVAERYDRARPDYPAELFAELTALAGIGPGSELLEVGSGTGRATIPLARLGCRITCLEPGGQLAELAAAKLPLGAQVQFVPGTFEDFDPAGREFDLVYAAWSGTWSGGSVVSTFSSTLVMEAAQRDWLLHQIRELIGRRGGRITRHWLAILQVTRRQAR